MLANAGPPPDARPLGPPHDRRPQRRRLLRLDRREPLNPARLITAPAPDNFPPIGSVLAKLRPTGRPLPDFIHTPDWMSNNGSFLPGQDAGFLGAAFEPFVAGDPSLPDYKVPGLELPSELPLDRVEPPATLLECPRSRPRRRRGGRPGSTPITARRIR